jgi:hypothetical protein
MLQKRSEHGRVPSTGHLCHQSEQLHTVLREDIALRGALKLAFRIICIASYPPQTPLGGTERDERMLQGSLEDLRTLQWLAERGYGDPLPCLCVQAHSRLQFCQPLLGPRGL